MSTDRYVQTSVSIRPDQKEIIQTIQPQKISEHIRNLLDALISGTELDGLPPEVAEKVVYSRRMAKIMNQNVQKEMELKENFFHYLDLQKYPKFISKYSKRKALKIGKEYAYTFLRFEGNILPECYIMPFLSEYYDLTKGSKKMLDACLEMQNAVSETISEEI